MDVGGPDFVYPPPALASAAGGYGRPGRSEPDRPGGACVLSADRHAPRPDAGARRRPTGCCGRAPTTRCGVVVPGAVPAIAHVPVTARRVATRAGAVLPPACACVRHRLGAGTFPVRLAVASRCSRSSALVELGSRATGDPELDRNARVVPFPSRRRVGTVAEGRRDARGARSRSTGARSGRSAVSSTATRSWSTPHSTPYAPLRGRHTLTITRPGADLAPGDGGAATLAAIFLSAAARAHASVKSSLAEDSGVSAPAWARPPAWRPARALRCSGSCLPSNPRGVA